MAGTPAPARRAVHRPAAVIFDMDGLLLDTEPLAARAWIDAAVAMGIDFDPAVNRTLVGRNADDCIVAIRAHHGEAYPAEALMHAWRIAYDAIVAREGVAIKPGVGALLAWLEAERIPRAVATSTRRARAEAKLARASLVDRFGALVGGDETARGKPAPDIVLAAAARLAVAVEDCIVLEDSEPGIMAAITAGAMPIMVPDLAPPSAALLLRAPPVFASLVDVHAHLASLPVATGMR